MNVAYSIPRVIRNRSRENTPPTNDTPLGTVAAMLGPGRNPSPTVPQGACADGLLDVEIRYHGRCFKDPSALRVVTHLSYHQSPVGADESL